MSRAGHFVAIIGGAVAGAEAAGKLAQSGIRCVIFEQHALPYGKLETPHFRLGQDIYIEELIDSLGFSAILLATGAWRDRPLDVEGIDAYVNKGLYYQNPFVAWYNRSHDPAYQHQHFDIFDQTIVVGGGLASLDVMKILAIETTRNALEQHGHKIDSLSIEKKVYIIYFMN
jgi:NADPH-dependent glutamate synthase beta subunit-like oxidoreductase